MTQPPVQTQVVEASAANWFARLQGEPDLADWQAFQAWLEADPQHRAAYAKLEALWVELEDQNLNSDPSKTPPDPKVVPFPARSRRAAIWFAVAAAAAVLVLLLLPSTLAPHSVTYATGKGEIRRVDLADGSHLTLGGDTQLGVRLDRRTRKVDMAQGEATFDVAHDASRPFEVALGVRQVTVLGTEFNIRRAGDALSVTVRRGAVALTEGARGQRVTVVNGQRAEAAKAGAPLVVRPVDADAAFAWTSGRLVYDHAPLAQVVADLNRYGATTIRLDPDAQAIQITGVLRIEDQAAMISHLELFSPIESRVDSGQIVLRIKANHP